LSVFKPVWIDSGIPDDVIGQPQGSFDENTLFWKHEILHREVLRNYPERSRVFQLERNKMEDEFLVEETKMRYRSTAERRAFTEACFRKSEKAEEKWLSEVLKVPVQRVNVLYGLAWKQFNREAGWVSSRQLK
jgi:dipeptidase